MIMCSNCKTASEDMRVSGPILWATGVVTFSDVDRTVVAISPLQAVQTIEVGQELTSESMILECPVCKSTGPISDFLFVAACIITGQPTTEFVKTPFGNIPAIDAVVGEVVRIFSKQAGAWEAPFDEDVYV